MPSDSPKLLRGVGKWWKVDHDGSDLAVATPTELDMSFRTDFLMLMLCPNGGRRRAKQN